MRFYRTKLWSVVVALTLGQAGPSVASDWIYHARDGDTFWDICLQYTNKRGCWLKLGDYNGIRNDRAIPLGREIRIPIEWLAQPPVVGQARSVQGDVIYRQNSSAAASQLVEGQDLHLGSRLTSTEGSARLQFGTGNEVLLRANSILDLDTMSGAAGERHSAEIGLPSGAVEVKVAPGRNSRFRITTPAAIAAVRGTEYRVESVGANGDKMRSEVLEGAVAVDSGKASVDVPAGFGVATVKGQSPSEPRQLLPPPEFIGDYSAVALPVTVRWNRHPEAVEWSLDLYADGGSKPLLASYRPADPELLIEALQQGCYTMRLRAIDAEGFNGLDADAALCIVPRLGAVQTVDEISSDPDSDSMRVSWSAVDGASKYRVEISETPDFSNIVESLDSDSTRIEFRRSDESSFYLRVIAIDKSGNESATGAVQEFTPQQRPPWEILAVTFIWFLIAI